jgi:hypothetical protein
MRHFNHLLGLLYRCPTAKVNTRHDNLHQLHKYSDEDNHGHSFCYQHCHNLCLAAIRQ